MIFLDLETEKITSAIPPKPVGLAVYKDEPVYITDMEVAKRVWFDCIKEEVCFHNAAFDISVAVHHWGSPIPEKFNDTLFKAFLHNPYEKSLKLKDLADTYTYLPPEEAKELKAWILANVQESKPSNWGAFISEAPVELVAPYAIGDVVRTKALWELYDVPKEPYDREISLSRRLIRSKLRGIRLSDQLECDIERYQKVLWVVNEEIYDKLGCDYEFNIDSDATLASKLENFVSGWDYTPTGLRKTSIKSLVKYIQDPELLSIIQYRSKLCTYLNTFMIPWSEKSHRGRIHFDWNQTRNPEDKGAKTGRMSSTPSMLNVPKTGEGRTIEWLPPLPNVRSYLLPEEGQFWFRFDYSQQELRILAHYLKGELRDAYINNPKLDMHGYLAEKLNNRFDRHTVKTIGFSIIYYAGLDKLSEQLGVSVEQAGMYRNMYFNALPGIDKFRDKIKQRLSGGGYITTFGGRQYYKETSAKGWDLAYRGPNTLLQGSGADGTKQAICNMPEEVQYQIAVHDEINISGDIEDARKTKIAMSDIPLSVPLLTDSFIGPSYGELHEVEL